MNPTRWYITFKTFLNKQFQNSPEGTEGSRRIKDKHSVSSFTLYCCVMTQIAALLWRAGYREAVAGNWMLGPRQRNEVTWNKPPELQHTFCTPSFSSFALSYHPSWLPFPSTCCTENELLSGAVAWRRKQSFCIAETAHTDCVSSMLFVSLQRVCTSLSLQWKLYQHIYLFQLGKCREKC